MSDENFSAVAANFPEPFRLLVRDQVQSTNDEVRALAEMGAADGLVLLTKNQTAGRGRRGAAWFSPPGESLAFSILVRPEQPKAWWPRLALATGLAVAEAIEAMGIPADIKWPNDVWIRGKKTAGILVETGVDFAVVGIGINVNATQFPPEVSEIATSLRLQSSQPFSDAEVMGEVIRKFAERRLQIGDDFGELISALRRHCILTGKRVALNTSNGRKIGTVEGISASGELILRTEAGLEHLIQADDVRLLPSDSKAPH